MKQQSKLKGRFMDWEQFKSLNSTDVQLNTHAIPLQTESVADIVTSEIQSLAEDVNNLTSVNMLMQLFALSGISKVDCVVDAIDSFLKNPMSGKVKTN
jgi:hypothetical protein